MFMRITFDKRADAMYIYFKDKKVAHTKELDDSTYVDYDKDGSVIGIEILSASRRIPVGKLSKAIKVEELGKV